MKRNACTRKNMRAKKYMKINATWCHSMSFSTWFIFLQFAISIGFTFKSLNFSRKKKNSNRILLFAKRMKLCTFLNGFNRIFFFFYEENRLNFFECTEYVYANLNVKYSFDIIEEERKKNGFRFKRMKRTRHYGHTSTLRIWEKKEE